VKATKDPWLIVRCWTSVGVGTVLHYIGLLAFLPTILLEPGSWNSSIDAISSVGVVLGIHNDANVRWLSASALLA
jgi:hypothetical protein